MGRGKDYTNKKFGNLTAIRRVDDYIQTNGIRRVRWECRCICGNLTYVLSGNMNEKPTKSCGCLNHKPKSLTHGGRYKKSYGSWRAMKRRCYETSNKVYHNYGGRGIKVCERWLESFENFYNDMGDCPKGYSLDRIDVNGDYTPKNCRWATITEQNCNRRDNIKVGESKLSLSQYCRENGLKYRTILSRLRRGITFEESISY